MNNNVVSLFSGCGGLDLGFKQAGYEIIWANDSDKFAVQTYKKNIGNHIKFADIKDINMEDIPEHDVLLAGIPCQPFSILGNSLGFNDIRGTLFFNVAKIIQEKQPEVVVIENVKKLKTHDKGRTYKVIKNILKNKLGYKVYDAILNTADYGVPQTRNRTFIVCFKNHIVDFMYPKTKKLEKTMQDLLEKNVADKYFLSEQAKKYILSPGTKNYYAKPETDKKIARTLTATMHKMHRAGQDNYVTDNGRLRRLTPRECARLQGFSDDFIIEVSDTQAYRQFGNAVTVDVAYAIAKNIKQALEEAKKWDYQKNQKFTFL